MNIRELVHRAATAWTAWRWRRKLERAIPGYREINATIADARLFPWGMID
jgi:hypothetical protein